MHGNNIESKLLFMIQYPHCKPNEVFLGNFSNHLIRNSILPGIRQCTENGESVHLSGGSNGHISSRLATFAPLEEVRRLQRQARKAGGTPYDLDVLTNNFQA